MQLPLYTLIRFYFQSTGTCNLSTEFWSEYLCGQYQLAPMMIVTKPASVCCQWCSHSGVNIDTLYSSQLNHHGNIVTTHIMLSSS